MRAVDDAVHLALDRERTDLLDRVAGGDPDLDEQPRRLQFGSECTDRLERLVHTLCDEMPFDARDLDHVSEDDAPDPDSGQSLGERQYERIVLGEVDRQEYCTQHLVTLRPSRRTGRGDRP